MSKEYIFSNSFDNSLYEKIERKALIINISLNLLLIISGIIFYFITKSSSILFDGVYSGIMTITSGLALMITYVSKKKSDMFPFGKNIFEDIFSLFKNLMVLIVAIFFSYDAISSLVDISTNKLQPSIIQDVVIYSIYISIVCSISIVIISIYFFMNKKIEGKSVILKAEIKSSIIDFLISFSIGLALFISSLIPGNTDIIREIIDRCITIVLIISIIPFVIKGIIYDLFNISGKRLYKDEENKLKEHLSLAEINDIYIRRHNKQVIIFIYVHREVNFKEINEHIYEHYSRETNIYYIFK